MINSDFLVIDFEGFRHKFQQFIPKEISVRGANNQDTIILQPPVKFSLLAEENKKTYAWLTENTALFGKLGVTITHSFSISSTRSNLDCQTVAFFQKVPSSALEKFLLQCGRLGHSWLPQSISV